MSEEKIRQIEYIDKVTNNTCIICGSWELGNSLAEKDGDELSRYEFCEECGASWIIYYKITKVHLND